MTYRVEIKRSAFKQLQKLPPETRRRLVKAVDKLSETPRPSGSRKLVGRPAWRIRVGDYRIIYEINDDKRLVVVIAIGHRKAIYQ